MKIAYISTPFLADCDLPLLRELRLLGHEVIYFLMISPSSRQGTVINLPALYPKGGLVPAREYPSLSGLKAWLPSSQIYVVNMPKAHDWAPSSLRAVNEMYVYIRRHDFDVVHVTSPLRYGSFILYRLRRHMVMTMHDPLPHSSDTGWLNRLHRSVALRRVNNFIILSERLREEFVSTYNLYNKKIFTTGLGVYESLRQTGPEELPLPENYILFAGSINPHKGIKYLCEAFKELYEAGHKELSLVVAGRGKFDFDIRQYTRELPVQVINRFVTDGELVSLISGARMVVCPYTDATQSGVIMSSFALDKPVIATDTGALADMLTSGRHGLLVAPRDSNAIASAVESMLRPGVLEKMAANIHNDFAEGSRSWANIARMTAEIYKEAARG
ncbi:MAG: glycosyltransferase family 4 protein [Prevotella sp.]|nr:glycosyltransferase family 4 protein [Prevotella sp.]